MVKLGYYTTSDVARMLKINKMQLYRWEKAGRLPKAKRHPMNDYRVYTDKDLSKIKKLLDLKA